MVCTVQLWGGGDLRCLISGDLQHFSPSFFSTKREQQMRERRDGEVLKGVGSVTRVIVQFEYWHPHSHEGAINSPAAHDLDDHQPPLMSDPHKASHIQLQDWDGASSVGAKHIHFIYNLYQSTDLPWVELCVSSIWLSPCLAVSTVTDDSCGGGKGSDCDVGLSSERCFVTIALKEIIDSNMNILHRWLCETGSNCFYVLVLNHWSVLNEHLLGL